MSDSTRRDASNPADASSRALTLWVEEPANVFSPRELERLVFMRWLFRHGRLTEFPDEALDQAA